jgi:RNA polymerase sigma-70 factor (ECF subfamily)
MVVEADSSKPPLSQADDGLGVEDAFLEERQKLFGYLYRMLGDAHKAEDLLQETWMVYAKAMDKGEQIDSPVAWCRGVARHLMQKHWRSLGRAKVVMDSELMDLVELSYEEAAPPSPMEERKVALGHCMETLPSDARTLLEQKYEKRMSFAEMAEIRSVKASALMMKASRLRSKLAQCIEQRMSGSSQESAR